MRVAFMLRQSLTTWALVTMKPSSETSTPLANDDVSADSSQVKNSILLAKRPKISSADKSSFAAAERETGGRDTEGS
jgi:hypothetical protein